MKQLLVLLAIGCLAVGAYKIHSDRVKDAAELAAIEARAAQPRGQAVGLTKVIEPFYNELFSDLNQNDPADLVPPLETVRERILDKQTHAEAEKQPIYDLAIRLLTAMAAVGEERTKTLQSLLQAAQTKASLEGQNSMTRSGAFFAQSVAKRWDDERRRRKPPLDQMFAQLRSAEREWNKRLGEDAKVENYKVPRRAPVYITADQVAPANPLDRNAYNQQRVVYPWRATYYSQYGYPTYR